MYRRIALFVCLGWIDRARLRGYSAILLIAAVPALVHFYRQAMGPTGSDFLAFWSAGKLVAAGAASSVYDTLATGAVQATLGRHDVFAFVNPPPFLFVAAPLGLLSYPVAWGAWVSATYLFWFAMTRRLAVRMGWPLAAFPGALVGAWHAQTGLLTGGLQAGFAAEALRRPFVAGLWVGALVIKPHLALLFPFAFLAGRQWRMLGGAVVSAVVLMALAWGVFGRATMLAYPQSWEVSRYLMDTGSTAFFLRQTTVYAVVRGIVGAGTAMVVQLAVSALMAALVWQVWRKSDDMGGKVACLLAATPLATPYLFSYDLPFLVVPMLWLAENVRHEPVAQGWRPVLLLFWISPLLGRALALPLGLNLTPFFIAALLCCIVHRMHLSHPLR